MLGKILAAVAGKKAAEHTNIGGTGGAILGIAAASLVRRLSPIGLIALAAGGYAFKRHLDKREHSDGARAAA